MKIGIVNDLKIAIETMRQVLRAAPEHDLIWIAKNGAEAVEFCLKETPDLILMDLMMPVMDGVESTRRIMKQTPTAILIVTSTVAGHSSKVFEAMGAGALDVVATPVFGDTGAAEGGKALLDKIRRIARLQGDTSTASSRGSVPARKAAGEKPSGLLVAIGCSTGGPKILVNVLEKFPKTFPGSVVVIQHMDQKFTPGLVDWLDTQVPMSVKIARQGDFPEIGKILLACTDDHLTMTPKKILLYTKEPRDNFYHPSVDVFFNSVAQCWPGRGIAVLLTGMGKDGAEGLLALRRLGWYTIAQDQSTSIVYGMPKAAADIDAACDILPAGAIGDAILKHIAQKK